MLQVQSLQEAALQKEAGLAAWEEQLLRDLEESQAGEGCSRNSLRVLEAEVSELRLRVCSTESRAQALATGCQQPTVPPAKPDPSWTNCTWFSSARSVTAET